MVLLPFLVNLETGNISLWGEGEKSVDLEENLSNPLKLKPTYAWHWCLTWFEPGLHNGAHHCTIPFSQVSLIKFLLALMLPSAEIPYSGYFK